ncbi:CHAT domain-containing protein [Thermodesulfobacteriota bacterium]
MGNEKTNGPGDKSSSVEEILREKERLDQILREEFKKEVTILFTDICGYTHYMETMGDIRGRAMLQKHNDIVMPIVEKFDGVVIKTIGDAVMATFGDQLKAVQAAVAIQAALNEHNRSAEETNKIHVKIGVNSGHALVDAADVFGDAVNVAARIQGKAGKDEILISENLYEQICASDDILCRYHGSEELKGKAEPLELYRVAWQDEGIFLEEAQVRSREKEPPIKKAREQTVFQLEVALEKDNLKISAHEQAMGESITVRHYEEIPVSIDKINTRCIEVVDTLNKTNRLGRVSRDTLMKLRSIGQVFSDDLFTHQVKEKLQSTQAENLIINLDDQLVQIPWELLHDGHNFLCQRFSMGRLVRTRQSVPGSGRSRILARPLKMMILADPKGDLKGAYKEGKELLEHMDGSKEFINASLRSEGITPDYIREKIRNFDIVHFAGHSDYDSENPGESGWRLSDGSFKGKEIIKMAGTDIMPALIFSNACQSARTEEWGLRPDYHEEIFGLANAFVLAGVKHYVGTFWEILDEPSSRFALVFYERLLSGMTVGEAMRQARQALIKEYGEETIVWGSYLLYGDPTFNYMDQIRMVEREGEPELSDLPAPEKVIRAKEEVIDFAEKEVKKKRPVGWMAAAAIALLVVILLWGYPGFLREGTEKFEQAALSSYAAGKFDEALTLCDTLENKNAKLRLIYLLRGNIAFRSGKLEDAQTAYTKAIKASKGTEQQKAGALIGLGRIASLQKQPDTAAKYYQEASAAAPESSTGYLSHALVLENKGDYGEALKLLGKAHALEPDDQAISAVTRETQQRAMLSEDKEKQARIDKLVKELLQSMDQPPRALPSDGWTSVPLTLWMMDFKTQGYSLQEGEDRLLAAGMTDRFIEKSRVQVVERALLDKLLEELKLGTSKLTDRSTALALGKILAARTILFGRIIHSGPQTQISVRLIETETGRVTASVSEAFGSAVPSATMSDKLSESLIQKMQKLYPLRGKISKIEGEDIVLNIGSKVGVAPGQKYTVANGEVTLEVISTQADSSLAKVLKGTKELTEQQRIEELRGSFS